jgi:hypothetical protein
VQEVATCQLDRRCATADQYAEQNFVRVLFKALAQLLSENLGTTHK